jgi:hypothetical protein
MKMIYDLVPQDYEFVKELAKIGYVHVMTRQVMVKGPMEIYNVFEGGMKIPANWSIEYVGTDQNNNAHITFGVGKLK